MKVTSEIVEQAEKEGRRVLLEPEAKAVCVEYGVSVTAFRVALDEGEAVRFAARRM